MPQWSLWSVLRAQHDSTLRLGAFARDVSRFFAHVLVKKKIKEFRKRFLTSMGGDVK